MKKYFEDLWERLPAGVASPDFAARSAFLTGELRVGERVLDLGCGVGEFTALAAAVGARAIGIEVAQAALARARAAHPGLEFRETEIDGPLPIADNSFEVVWASEVVEHVADTARWLSEVRRVLVPAGRLLITTPSHGRLRVALGGVERFSEPLGDHLHLYTQRSLRELLAEFGFGQIDVRRAGGPPLLRRMLLARAVR
ncbi:MAG: class I SAM-dependent methyltransferase [Solirubrobacteraceae bacterium]